MEDFELGRLKPLSHSREAISSAMIAHLGRRHYYPEDKLPPRRKRAFERFKYQGSWKLGDPDNIEDLTGFFDLFNDMYFNGLITGYCKIVLLKASVLRKRFLESDLIGHCDPCFPREGRDPRFQPENVMCTLSIVIQDNCRVVEQKGPWTRIQDHLDTLIHEMLHAMFDIYTCRCEHGCRQKQEVEGGGGHHTEWLAVAKAIERKDGSHSQFPCLGLDFGRLTSLIADLQLGYNLPTPSILKILDLDIVKILEKLRSWRKNDFERDKVIRAILMPSKKSRCIRVEWTVDSWERSFGYDGGKWSCGFILDVDLEDFPGIWQHIDSREVLNFYRRRRFEQRAVYRYENLPKAMQHKGKPNC